MRISDWSADVCSSDLAVIASGVDIAFPPENAALQERIAIDQLLIAEQPPGSEPLARHFPARNRIIAGLALGPVVIEAAPRSGSLITARRAGDYGRGVRSDESRGGEECVSTGRSWWAPYN